MATADASTRIQTIRDTFVSWDFVAALVTGVVVACMQRKWQLSFAAAHEIFSMSIAALSILFSVCFAVLALSMTASDNEFILFLQEDGSFERVLSLFRVTALVLFTSLSVSIVLFVSSAECVSTSADCTAPYPGVALGVYAALVVWSLLGALMAVIGCLEFDRLRTRYIKTVFEIDCESRAEGERYDAKPPARR